MRSTGAYPAVQVGVGQGRIAVVVVVGGIAAVEVVVVTLAGEFVEPRGGLAQLLGGHTDPGGELVPAACLFDDTGFQPGRRDLPAGGNRRERNLGNGKVSGDDI